MYSHNRGGLADQGVKVHAGNESDEEGESNDSLALEDLLGHHGIFGELPFPDYPGDNEEYAND